MNVLITGGGGFIGSHLVESQLNQGNHVRAVDLNFNRILGLKHHQNLKKIEMDITRSDQIHSINEGVDVVYHLASAHLDVRLSPEHYQQVNVDATLNLLKSAHIHNVKRFVHCSSVGVIGDVINPPADETAECRPNNIYEQTKLEGERKVIEYARKTGFNVIVARPAWVYGPRCPRTEKLLRTIGKGRFVIFGNGKNLRHPVYITDAVRGLELCTQKEVSCGEVYILAGEKPVTIKELVRVASHELGRGRPIIQLPVVLGNMISVLMEMVFIPVGRQPPFSRRSMDFFLKNNAYDISKANRDLGFYPQVDLEIGIRETVRHNMRAHG